VFEIIEPEMKGSFGAHRQRVGAGRLSIRKIDGQLNVCFFIAGVEYAGRFVAGEFRRGAIAPGGDIAFGDRPYFFSDVGFHDYAG